MRKEIRMGNDEFILYIRKWNKECRLPTDDLGRKIWEWIRENDPEAVEEPERDVRCHWGGHGSTIDALNLPKTATQFCFRRDLLPRLYDFLDSL